MVNAWCVFVTSIQSSRTWMSGSFESMWCNAFERVLENGVRPHVNSKEKIPSTGGSEKGWTRSAASCRTASPAHYRLSYSGLNWCFKPRTWFPLCWWDLKLDLKAQQTVQLVYSLTRQMHWEAWGSFLTRTDQSISSFMYWRKEGWRNLLLVGCLTSQQHASVSQGRICTDNFTCCHTEMEAADQTFHLTQSQYTDTRPTSPSADPITPGAWQGSHWSANF